MSTPEGARREAFEEREACLFFSLLQAKVGSSVLRRLGGLSPSEAMNLTPEKFAAVTGVTEKVRGIFEAVKADFDAEEKVRELERRGISLLTLSDEEYPERLREVVDPPPALFVKGELPGGESVAVVGSRKVSVGGVEVAERLGRALAERGVSVVSGLALGVDAAAHRGSLSGGGRTVGVLGCGIDVVYPRKNRDLFEEIGAGRGAIVSEYYFGEAPLAWHFPARNRVISGLVGTVVVVEAAERSGALITARHALEAGRDVWAAPGPVGAPECRGSNKLLADGAGVLWDIEEFAGTFAPPLEEPARRSPPVAESVPESLRGVEREALLSVGFTASGVDEISGRSGIGVRELLPALAMLELKGYLARDANGAYVRKVAP